MHRVPYTAAAGWLALKEKEEKKGPDMHWKEEEGLKTRPGKDGSESVFLGSYYCQQLFCNFSTVSSLQNYYWQPEGLLTQC